MAVTNVYRNNPTDGAIKYLQSRKSLYKNGPHYEAATVNPAYIKLTFSGKGGTKNIPNHLETFEARQINSGLKTNPSLEDVKISNMDTEYGSREAMSWTIKCFNRADFESFEKVICRHGTKVSATFGYAKHWLGDQTSITIKDFIICSFGFNTDQQGNWIITGSATRATEALKKLECNSGIKAKNLRYKSGPDTFTAKGLAEVMTYDAQNNGSKAIDDIDLAGHDGWVFNKFKEHYGPLKDAGACIVYKSSHKTAWSGQISKWLQGAKEYFDAASSVTSSVNTVYYSLQYVVSRLIMGQTHAHYVDGVLDGAFAKTVIKFDPKLSHSWIDNSIISGLPTQVVLCGINKGNYRGSYGPGDELGINFEDVGGAGLSPIKAVLSAGGGVMEVDPSKLILERSVILGALESATHKEVPNADKTNDKTETEETINVLEFLRKLFQVVKEATGGSIMLGFMQHPEEHNTLVIIDQKNGKATEPLKCVVFNGIDGDGSTRTITLASRAGSPEMASSMMAGQTTQGDVIHNLNNDSSAISNKRQKNYNDARRDIRELILSPASLIKSRFDATQESALCACVNAVRINKPDSHTRKYDTPTYPGLELNVELDGVYGFRVGNAISSKHMSPAYFNNKAYFMVRGVEHTFTNNGSDWSTSLSGILSYYSDIEYIHL